MSQRPSFTWKPFFALPLFVVWTAATFAVVKFGDFSAGEEPPLGLVALVIGVIVLVPSFVGAVFTHISRSGEWEKQEAGRRQAAVDDEARRVRQRAEQEASERDGQVRRAGEAARLYGQLPGLLDQSGVSLKQARQHFSNGAFSPFWSAVEAAFAGLADYRLAVEGVRSHARDFQGFAQLPHCRGIEFPVSVDEAEVVAAAEKVAEPLTGLVYEAQRDAVFAQIWEQRRTTAAVVAGFRNLEDAVDRMGAAIASEVSSLRADVQGTSNAVEAASRTASSSAANLASIAQSQLRELEETRKEVAASAERLRLIYRRDVYGY